MKAVNSVLAFAVAVLMPFAQGGAASAADVKGSKDHPLGEIAKLMKARLDLKLLVVGHTDNQGDLNYNMDLSKRRAAAVVKALTKSHGIGAARLTPAGVAFLAPVASMRGGPRTVAWSL